MREGCRIELDFARQFPREYTVNRSDQCVAFGEREVEVAFFPPLTISGFLLVETLSGLVG